jgi:rod shape-determining protein MreC
MLLVLIAWNLPNRTVEQIKIAISSVFLPLFGLASSTQQIAQKVEKATVSRSTLVAEIERLRLENQQYQMQQQQTEELVRENQRLRDALGMARAVPAKFKLARVIGRDPANWWLGLRIDLGLQDGIKPNQVVRSPEGLIGRIQWVGPHHSQLVLVGDVHCCVSALIQETRDSTGIIVPSTTDVTDNTVVELTHISRTTVIKPGQKVVTSGQGGLFPKGILIGSIIDSRSVDYGLYNVARVKLAVNFNRLEEVWVIMP